MSFHTDVTAQYANMLKFAWKLARNTPDAQDLVQETILHALEAEHRFTPGTNLSAWLTAILRNTFYSGCRKKKREVIVDPSEPMLDRSVNSNQYDYLRYKDVIQRLEASANDATANRHRRRHPCGRYTETYECARYIRHQILIDMALTGDTHDQIASRYELPVGTIKSMVWRARRDLEKEIM
jgi:RNA polymerase sigma factor (sigma-70 family)